MGKKIWVYIEPAVTSDGAAGKTALTDTAKEAVTNSMVAKITAALPAEKFSTADADKPIQVTDAYNAIKIVPTLTIKVETQGSKMTVTCTLKMTFEAIRAPATKNGNLLGTGSKTAGAENRGLEERHFLRNVDDVLDAIAAPLATQVMSNPTFKSYGKNLGLAL